MMTEKLYRWNRNAATYRDAISTFSRGAMAVALWPSAMLFGFALWTHQGWALTVALPFGTYLFLYFAVLLIKVGAYRALNELSYKEKPAPPPPPHPPRSPIPVWRGGKVADYLEGG